MLRSTYLWANSTINFELKLLACIFYINLIKPLLEIKLFEKIQLSIDFDWIIHSLQLNN